jgi:hypothetical protein
MYIKKVNQPKENSFSDVDLRKYKDYFKCQKCCYDRLFLFVCLTTSSYMGT